MCDIAVGYYFAKKKIKERERQREKKKNKKKKRENVTEIIKISVDLRTAILVWNLENSFSKCIDCGEMC